jgi:hypothetical protein
MPFGAPQQFLYFFPEPHPQGSLRPVWLLIFPSGPEFYSSYPERTTIRQVVQKAEISENLSSCFQEDCNLTIAACSPFR